ncbi:MAG: hypothetical protein HAW62_03985 [Endozoicomonadaceae bacterium]|nr:hypothetical protein [Endozoicomonadaceae bacterium]
MNLKWHKNVIKTNHKRTINQGLSYFFLKNHKEDTLQVYTEYQTASDIFSAEDKGQLDNYSQHHHGHISAKAYYGCYSQIVQLMSAAFFEGEEGQVYHYFFEFPSYTIAIVMGKTKEGGWIAAYNSKNIFKYKQCMITNHDINIETDHGIDHQKKINIAKSNFLVWKEIIDYLELVTLENNENAETAIALLSFERINLKSSKQTEREDEIAEGEDEIAEGEDEIAEGEDEIAEAEHKVEAEKKPIELYLKYIEKSITVLALMVKNGHFIFNELDDQLKDWVSDDDLKKFTDILYTLQAVYQAISYGYARNIGVFLIHLTNRLNSLEKCCKKSKSLCTHDVSATIERLFQPPKNSMPPIGEVVLSQGNLEMFFVLFDYLKTFTFNSNPNVPTVLNYTQAISIIAPSSLTGLKVAFEKNHHVFCSAYIDGLLSISEHNDKQAKDIKERFCGLFSLDYDLYRNFVEKKFLGKDYLAPDMLCPAQHQQTKKPKEIKKAHSSWPCSII